MLREIILLLTAQGRQKRGRMASRLAMAMIQPGYPSAESRPSIQSLPTVDRDMFICPKRQGIRRPPAKKGRNCRVSALAGRNTLCISRTLSEWGRSRVETGRKREGGEGGGGWPVGSSAWRCWRRNTPRVDVRTLHRRQDGSCQVANTCRVRGRK